MGNNTKIHNPEPKVARRIPSQDSTKLVTVKNNGADDKFSVAISCATEGGGYYIAHVADSLQRGEKKEIDISGLGLKITRATIFWRDRNGIGRYTCAKQAQPDSFFLSLLGWWVAVPSDETVEEHFLSGTEVFP